MTLNLPLQINQSVHIHILIDYVDIAQLNLLSAHDSIRHMHLYKFEKANEYVCLLKIL